ncbi:Ff.00g042200.m01.CDS01 [Fusarium sp. VM40]|nr:Ff.00g042200.m01.CDS01 [Fusarium sp. VM40]
MADLGFGIAGLVGTIDACIKVGQFLVQAYKDYNQADSKVNELSVRIQICWSRIVSQLEIIKKLESGMTEEQRDLQSRFLRILQSKLDAAMVVISKPDGHADSKRTKALHFLNLRESLESTVSELESWQRRFEPSWFEVIKTGPSAIDGVLHDAARSRAHDVDQPAREARRFRRAFNESQSVMLGEKSLDTLKRASIPFCKAEVAVEEKEGKHYIIDTISQDIVKLKHARELAIRLRDSNPFTFGTLKYKGIVRKQEQSSLIIVFRVPDGYSRV